jgi:glycosyltransferase involved in cell wall biosynthesis
MPFFTIITATYNAAATLPRLLDSLSEQTCRDFELIIQDGASTDDTVAVAESIGTSCPPFPWSANRIGHLRRLDTRP